jgi:lactoylglutathione lyase/glyoxylase I family protein
MIKALAHICISTNSLDETEKFYCSCLGLSKKFNFIRDGKVFGYYLQINESNFIEVFLADADSSEKEPQVTHFCLEVDDIDKTIEEIKNCGVSVTDKEMGLDNSWQAWITDPNGIKIELHQYTEKSSQVVGSDCVI